MNKALKLFFLLILCQQSEASDWRIWSLCRENLSRLTGVGATALATVLTGPVGGAVTFYTSYLWDKYSSTSARIESKKQDLSSSREQIAQLDQLKARIERVRDDFATVNTNCVGACAEAQRANSAVISIRQKADEISANIRACSEHQANLARGISGIEGSVSGLETSIGKIEFQLFGLGQQIQRSNVAQRAELHKLVVLSRMCGKRSKAALQQQKGLADLVRRNDELLQQARTNLIDLQAVGASVSPKIRDLESGIVDQLAIQRQIHAQLSGFSLASSADASADFRKTFFQKGLAAAAVGKT